MSSSVISLTAWQAVVLAAERQLSVAFVPAVLAYRKVISPRKGFCCAYAALHGPGKSCSDTVLGALRERVPFRAVVTLTRRQFQACADAEKALVVGGAVHMSGNMGGMGGVGGSMNGVGGSSGISHGILGSSHRHTTSDHGYRSSIGGRYNSPRSCGWGTA